MQVKAVRTVSVLRDVKAALCEGKNSVSVFGGMILKIMKIC